MTSEILLLLAEDDPLLRLATGDLLEDSGYGVVSSSNGSEAVMALEKQSQALSGLITDISMGNGPNGWEVAHRARELNPKIAVVYTTADSAAEWSANGVPKSILLQKPFADAQLVTAISTLLNDVAPDINP